MVFPAISLAGRGLSDYLERLDSAIEVRQKTDAGRQAEILLIKRDLAGSMPDTSRYSVLRDLYRLYRRFRCDSALLTAGERLEIARKTGDRKRIQSASLNLAESYEFVGDSRPALTIMDTITREGMEKYHLRYLYDIYVKSYLSLARSEVIPDVRIGLERMAERYCDSALMLFDDRDIAYHRLRARILASKGHYAEALKIMTDAETRLGLSSSNDNALMARLYEKTGNQEKAIEYMCEAALTDISSGTMTHGCLMRLALMLSERGDFKRAHRYIRIALDDASSAQARGLAREILEAVPLVDDAYTAHERDLFRWRLAFALAASAAALVLGLALWMTRRQLRRTQLAQSRAAALNSELEETNLRLKHADIQKSVILNEFFEAYSDAIGQRKELRRQIGRLLKTGQRSKAEDVVMSTGTEESSVQDMYARFDRMVLSLYPEFAEEFNPKVPEKYRITEETLPSEARVLALMRLGITSGGEIARLLHYSPQTVYNYRSRLKSWGLLG